MLHKLKSLVNKAYNYVFFYSYREKPAGVVFTDIYNKKKWSGDSYSGPGSDLDQTKLVRKGLRDVIDHYKINTILDIPCGDWYWMQHADLTGVSYLGADIVEEIIEKNQVYAKDNVAFKFLDLMESDLPESDLIFCRDCLVHFSYQDITRALNNMIKSGSKYLLTTTFPEHKNYDIVTGNWRPLNLQASPVALPEPLLTINEGFTESNGRYEDKSMALWDLSALKPS